MSLENIINIIYFKIVLFFFYFVIVKGIKNVKNVYELMDEYFDTDFREKFSNVNLLVPFLVFVSTFPSDRQQLHLLLLQ